MDGLLLLAAMTTAMGYEGRGRFSCWTPKAMSPRAGAARPRPSAYPGVQIVHPRLFADAPRRRLLHQPDVGPRHRQGPAFGTVLEGVWIHVGTPEARDEAEAYLAPADARVTRPSVFTIAASAPFRRDAGAGPDRAGWAAGSARAVRSRHLSAHPPRGAQLRRSLRAGAGRRGAVAAIPRRWATATKTNFCSTPRAKGWNCRPPSRRIRRQLAAGAAGAALGPHRRAAAR